MTFKHRLGTVGPVRGATYLYITPSDKSRKSHDISLALPYNKSWSWMVWYMDRNRVLPPGPVLNDYREADAARLRALDYPEPLFKMTYYIEYLSDAFIQSVKKLDREPQTPVEPLSEEPLKDHASGHA